MSTQPYGDRVQAAIAAELRAELARKKWSQARLAREAGVSPASVGRYLQTGDTVRDIPLNELVGMCEALGVEYIDVFSRADAALKAE